MRDNITINTTSASYIDSSISENTNCIDAVNRIFSYPSYPQSTSSVKFIKVKLEDQINLLLYEEKLCDLFVYFLRPCTDEFKDLKYEEFFEKYTYVRKTKQYIKPNEVFSKLYENEILNPTTNKKKTIHIQAIIKRRLKNDTLVMLQELSIKSGEKYYLRMLLKHKAAQSFEDLLTYENTKFSTYQESVKHHGFLKDTEFVEENF
jgi:hypothetical protein